tara:strand:+ start:899 stop:1159 length:261 start_codon:yes stop_codon:yes gene_type:complete
MSYPIGKFSKITKVTAKDFYATGSEKGSTGFFISGSVHGDSVLTSQHGEAVAATEFQTDTVYEIGMNRVSGSSVIYLLWPDPNKVL